MDTPHSPKIVQYCILDTRWRSLTLCRDALGVFYSPSRLGHRKIVGGGLFPLQRCTRCILQPQLTGPQENCWRGSFPSAEMHSVYSTAPADWAIEMLCNTKQILFLDIMFYFLISYVIDICKMPIVSFKICSGERDWPIFCVKSVIFLFTKPTLKFPCIYTEVMQKRIEIFRY